MDWYVDYGEYSLMLSYAYGMLRCLGLVLVFLSLGGKTVSHSSKVGISVIVLLVPNLFPVNPSVSWEWRNVAAELLLGALIGLPLLLVVQAGKMFGELFDAGRGQSIGTQYDPVSSMSSQVMSKCIGSWLVATLLFLGLLPQILMTLQQSFLAINPGSMSLFDLARSHRSVVELVILSLTFAFSVYVPCALLFLIVDLFAGFVSRLLPKFAIHGETFLVRTVVGFLMLMSSGASGLHWSLLEMCITPTQVVIQELSLGRPGGSTGG
jgi:flagellar biosynthesis protein FliR